MAQPTPSAQPRAARDLAEQALPALPLTVSTSRMRFYLTTHKQHWVRITDKPLFLKAEHFTKTKNLHPALGPYAVDSGGFSELQRHGRWTRTPRQYVTDLRRIWEHVGPYQWAAGQDWMCEDLIIQGGQAGPLTFAGTHLTVAEHQRRTVHNFLELRSLGPDLRIIPTLQGRTIDEYHACADLYERCGVNLRQEPVVGLGSVCRLQSTSQGAAIVTAMAARGYRLHGFGFKTLGLSKVGHLLASADSAAWSYHARKRPPLPGHTHKNCANCFEYAMRWRTRVLGALPTWHQPHLDAA